jgi:hypothetical protein
MQPVMTVCVVGHAGVIVQTDRSDGDCDEGAKGIQELIGGAGGTAIQVGEVLGDVNVASLLKERQEGTKFVGRGNGGTSDTDDKLMMLKKPENASDVR